jgi:putative aldouronate transport system permease protein
MAVVQRAIERPIEIPRVSFWSRLARDFVRNKYVYLMLVPVVGYYLIFYYGPMYGALIAFEDFSPVKGIWGSPWVGWQNFVDFFRGIYFWRLLRNTIAVNVIDLLFHFPAPILLAILLNEITSPAFKRVVQTITYMPHFISLVVVAGMLVDFLASDGLVNNLLIDTFGSVPIPFMQRADWYWTIYVGSAIWQNIGWGSIIYLAAITSIDPTLYEAAVVDGANRFQQIRHITIPGIMPTIIILLILRIGSMMTIGYEKTILLYNPMTYETADVISTYVYRKGVLATDFSFSAAVGLFNSVINFGLLVLANRISRRIGDMGLF